MARAHARGGAASKSLSREFDLMPFVVPLPSLRSALFVVSGLRGSVQFQDFLCSLWIADKLSFVGERFWGRGCYEFGQIALGPSGLNLNGVLKCPAMSPRFC